MVRAAVAILVCAAAGAAAAVEFGARPVPLEGEPGLVTLDYFAWDPARKRLWVPGGNSASVFVLDIRSDAVIAIGGFATAEVSRGERRARLGPSSVAIGEGVAYVGNRADSGICVIDAITLARGECLAIAPAPDAVAYVASTRDVWITHVAPPAGAASTDKALTILDASSPRTLRAKGKVALEGSAEGVAVDAARGRLYTNLRETGETVAIDLRTRAIVAQWRPGCDSARGLALDEERGFLFVACSSRVVSIDVKDGGRVLGAINTGAGLDNIDYSPAGRRLYAAASQAATLTVAFVTPWGRLEPLAVVPTVKGARGVVAGDGDTAFVADPANGRIHIVAPR